MVRVIDLTRESHQMNILLKSGVHDNDWTRIEAPSLLMNDGKMVCDYDPNTFIASAVLLDLSHKKPEENIDDEDLEAAEEAAGLAIRDGDIVLMRTGWGDTATDAHSANYPALSVNAVEFLGFRHILAFGVDTPSVDKMEAGIGEVHKALFQRGIFAIENLHDIAKIDETRINLMILPLKIRAAVSPSRVVAIVEQDG